MIIVTAIRSAPYIHAGGLAMKLWKITIAAMFALLMLTLPGRASANTGHWQPPEIQESAGYQLFATAYYGHHPYTCRDPRFRRHHRWLCW
jgi:hypothetical protein